MSKEKETESAPVCVLTLPLLTEPWQEDILETRFRIIEHLQNSLIAMELRKLKNLKRTKAFRSITDEIRKLYQEDKNAANQTKETAKKLKSLYEKRKKLLQDAGMTKFDFKDDMTPMQKHFQAHIAAQISHKAASDVWSAFDKYLFHGGKEVHFKRRGSLYSVACQEEGNGMRYRDGVFIWGGGKCKEKIDLHIKVQSPENKYEKELLKRKIHYLRVVRKWIKTRFKYYLQFTFDGLPPSKKREYGNGRVGIDIGTQSVAIASEKKVLLLELADRVNRNHEKIVALQRKMDRSKRLTNPDNFNPDGTICRGKKLRWTFSKRYRRMAGQVRELQRKNADIRKYQHTCLANYILTLGTDIFIEPMDFRALQRRAKKTEKNAAGRFKRKKRFGKSLANKAPSEFVSILKTKLKAAAGHGLYEVSKWDFRASQYDHLSGKYQKKTLGQRTFRLDNGDHLQRDLYSAFLLMNADGDLTKPDQELCEKTYENFKRLHDMEIQRLLDEERPHLSSFGIA